MASTISDGTTTLTPELVLGYATAQAGRNIIHDVLGRPDPDVSLAPAALRAGTLTLFFLTEADADAARSFHARPGVFTYAPDDNLSTGMRYVVAGSGISTTLDDQTRKRWTVAVGYQEVGS